MKITASIITFFFISVSLFSQNKWITSLEEGLKMSRETDKKIVLEIGSIVNEFALFIPDEIWNNDSVQVELRNYIPVSVELQERDPLIRKFNLDFSPTLIILDIEGNILFKRSGLIDEDDMKTILDFFQTKTYKIEKYISVYRKGDDVFGHLQKAEEYLYLATSSPFILNNYFLEKTDQELSQLYANREALDDTFNERFSILNNVYNYFHFYDKNSIKKLKKYASEEVSSTNKALLKYYQYTLEKNLGNFEIAAKYYRELDEMVGEYPQAKDYLERIKIQN